MFSEDCAIVGGINKRHEGGNWTVTWNEENHLPLSVKKKKRGSAISGSEKDNTTNGPCYVYTLEQINTII